MDTGADRSRAETDVLIRPLRAADLAAADRVRRLAFGTFLGLPDPLSFRGDASPVRTRYLADRSGSFAAEVNGDVVGTNFAVNWGSVGFFGPLSVHPDFWGRGIAQRLVAAALEAFARWETQHVGLFTFAHSPQHVLLYQKFGFWPRFLTLIMAKSVSPLSRQISWSVYSALPEAEQQDCLADCHELVDGLYSGLDLRLEIEATARHHFGETVLLRDGNALSGFAVCHCGAGTEAGSGQCYIKFGAVRSGLGAEVSFTRLLAACEMLAASRGVERLVAGVNTGRREAYRAMLAYGFRTDVQGLAMDLPDEAGYNRPDVYIVDDWR
jgi:GNAT superfamily N-acetyltransferase